MCNNKVCKGGAAHVPDRLTEGGWASVSDYFNKENMVYLCIKPRHPLGLSV